jgi:DNA polymerase-3 subunit delta
LLDRGTRVRIESDQLAGHLTRSLTGLYTVYGDEPLLALEAADLIRARARSAGYAERNVLTVESGFDWSELAMSGNSLSLFALKRLLELRIPSGKPGVEGAQRLADYARNLPADTLTLVSLPKLDRTQLASGWFDALDQAGMVVTANPVTAARLPRWLSARLSAQGHSAEEAALQFLAARTEGNLLAAHQEVQKLGLLFPPGKLTLSQIEEAVLDVARYDAFKLGECVLAGDSARLTRMLDGLQAEATAPTLVLWALSEEARALLYVMEGQEQRRPLQQLLRETRVWGARADLLPKAVRRFTKARLEDTLLYAAAVDQMAKGLVKGDVWDALLELGLMLTRPRAAVESR